MSKAVGSRGKSLVLNRETPISTTDSVKVMDVAWLGSDYAKALEQQRHSLEGQPLRLLDRHSYPALCDRQGGTQSMDFLFNFRWVRYCACDRFAQNRAIAFPKSMDQSLGCANADTE